MPTNKRVGLFTIHDNVLQLAGPVPLQAFFRDMVIIDLHRPNPLKNTNIGYFAACPDFDEVEPGQPIPCYKPTLHAIQFPDCTGYFVKWERVE